MIIKSINPQPGTLERVAATVDQSRPITMINLISLRGKALYASNGAGTDAKHERNDSRGGMNKAAMPSNLNCSGQEAYAEYSKLAAEHVQKVGGELVYRGGTNAILIGPADECWDQILIVRYPTFKAFCTMITDPNYQAIAVHRTAALDDSRLWATQER